MELNLGIMITTKCNRSCPHCMFFCSPNNKEAADLDLSQALNFIKTIPQKVDINEICIYGGEPILDYKRLKFLIKRLPTARRIQILTNGCLKNKTEIKKFETFCQWFLRKNHLIKISNDLFHDIFQDKNLLNQLIEKYPNLVWKRREDTREFIKMGRWKKHPTFYLKPPNCTLTRETLIIQQDGKVNFCCGGYSAAIGTFQESFTEIISKRHNFLNFLKKSEGHVIHNTCNKCRILFSQYFKVPLDTRWG